MDESTDYKALIAMFHSAGVEYDHVEAFYPYKGYTGVSPKTGHPACACIFYFDPDGNLHAIEVEG